MKLQEFQKAPKGSSRLPEIKAEIWSKDILAGQMTVDDCIADVEAEQSITEVTPSGLEIFYQWAPKRLYRIRRADPSMGAREPLEVPSVTTVLNVLDKSGALTYWGMKVGIDGVIKLLEKRALTTTPVAIMEEYGGEYDALVTPDGMAVDKESITTLLTEHKLTVNHQKDAAADRGVNVHDALEAWCRHGVLPILEQYPETERGYIEGLCAFLSTIQLVAEVDGMELMVGSLEHLYAGRLDLILNLSKSVEVVTKTYPKKTDKVEEIPAGRYLLDLKTSKRVYDTHFLQLEAYEQASVECGYQPTDYRGVVHVTEDGRYELAVNKDWQFEDFQVVRQAYSVMHERDRLRNEREIENDLWALGATNAAS